MTPAASNHSTNQRLDDLFTELRSIRSEQADMRGELVGLREYVEAMKRLDKVDEALDRKIELAHERVTALRSDVDQRMRYVARTVAGAAIMLIASLMVQFVLLGVHH